MDLSKIEDIHIAIRSQIHNNGGYENEDLFPEEIDLNLNAEISEFVDRVWAKNNVSNPSEVGFQGDMKHLSDIQSLVKEQDYVNFSFGSNPKTVIQELSGIDKRYIIRLFANYAGASDEYNFVRIYETEYIGQILDNPFSNPTPRSPVGVMIKTAADNEAVKVFTPKRSILLGFKLVYLKNPAVVKLDLQKVHPDLPKHVMQKIIDQTALRILEQSGSERYRTKTIENNN